MNKKGAELSMNVIIITILVVLVLVVVAVFFTGGMSSLTKRIAAVFTGQLTDLSEATASCNSYCLRYQEANSNNNDIVEAAMISNFCIKRFNVDLNADGKLDITEKDKICASTTNYPGATNSLGIYCQGLTC